MRRRASLLLTIATIWCGGSVNAHPHPDGESSEPSTELYELRESIPLLDPQDLEGSLADAGFRVVAAGDSEASGLYWLQATKDDQDVYVLRESSGRTVAASCKLDGSSVTGTCLNLDQPSEESVLRSRDSCFDVPICGCRPIQPPISHPGPLGCACSPERIRTYSVRLVVTPKACARTLGMACDDPEVAKNKIVSRISPAFAEANLKLDGVCARLQAPTTASVLLLESFDESAIVSDKCALVGLSLIAEELQPTGADVTLYLVAHSGWRGRAIQVPATPGRCAGALLEIDRLQSEPLLLLHEFGHLLGAGHAAPEQPSGCLSTYDWAFAEARTVMASDVGSEPVTGLNACAMNLSRERFW